MHRRFGLAATVLALAGCVDTPNAGSASATPSVGPSPTATASVAPTPSATGEPQAAPTWVLLDASGPPAREDHTWTVGGDGRTAFLFGGRDGPTVHGDLWAYDLDADVWTQLFPGEGPAARFGHEATWVDGVGLVVFAGQAGATFFNDLWAYDPDTGSWRELPSDGDEPVARYGTCAALGPDGRLWISHGFTADGTRFDDTRAYHFDSGEWTDESPDGGERPVERCLHACWWTDDGALTLYAGQTTGTTALGDRWRLADGAWSPAGGALPPDRNLYAHARLDGATLVFGGQALDGAYLSDLWLMRDDEADATELEAGGIPPSGRAGAELIHDSARDRVLLFGGRNDDGGFADLWAARWSVDDG